MIWDTNICPFKEVLIHWCDEIKDKIKKWSLHKGGLFSRRPVWYVPLTLIIGNIICCGARNAELDTSAIVSSALYRWEPLYLVWLVILNVYTHRESGKHENTFPTSLKWDCLKVVELSFVELLCLVAILTFTSSEEVHSWVPAIVIIRFSSLMFIFLEAIWWGWYMDPIPFYEWQCYILSYSGCQRAESDDILHMNWLARSRDLYSTENVINILEQSWETLASTSPATNRSKIVISTTRRMGRNPSTAHWLPRAQDR